MTLRPEERTLLEEMQLDVQEELGEIQQQLTSLVETGVNVGEGAILSLQRRHEQVEQRLFDIAEQLNDGRPGFGSSDTPGGCMGGELP